MDTFLKAYLQSSTLTAIIRLADKSSGVNLEVVSQADFERSIAREIAQHATTVANMDNATLETYRKSIMR